MAEEYLKILREIEEHDGCVIKFDDTIKKYTTMNIITFNCKCGTEHNKNFKTLKKTGAFCEECTLINQNIKIKQTWDNKKNVENIKNKDKYLKILKEFEEKDRCIIHYDNDVKSYNVDSKINFTCECGNEHSKSICVLQKTGAFCKECTQKNKIDKVKETSINKYGVENCRNNKEEYLKILRDIEKRDMCIIHYDNELKSYNRDLMINFTCHCGTSYSKTIRTLQKSNGICKKCTNKNKKTKTKDKCVELYGVENPQQNKEIREKTVKTFIERYGGDNNEGAQKIQEKRIATCIERFGESSYSKTEECKEKIKESNMEKYNVEYTSQLKEVRDKCKKTCLERYGCEYNSQNAEISEKQSKNAYKLKEFVFPCGNILMCQGYEPFLLKYLVENNYGYNDIVTKRNLVPEIWYLKDDKKHRYFCDVYIKKINTIFEVKSTWTYKKDIEDIPLKKQACIDAGYLFELFVYYENGKRELI